MNIAQRAADENDLGRALDLLKRQRPPLGKSELRGWEWRYLWQQCRSDEIATLGHHSGDVEAVAFSPDGLLVASVGANGDVKVWDVTRRRELASTNGLRGKVVVKFSADGKYLAFGGFDGLVLAEPKTLRRIEVLSSVKQAGEFAFSPDGTALALGYGNGDIEIWEIGPAFRMRSGWHAHEGYFSSISWSTDGKFLASCSSGECRIWNAKDGTLEKQLAGRTIATSFSPTEPLLVAASGTAVLFLESGSWKQIAFARGHLADIFDLAFSHDGSRLASAGGDQLIKIWDVASRSPKLVLKGHLDEVHSVAFSPDHQTIASGGKDSTVRLWPLEPLAPSINSIELEPGVFLAQPVMANRKIALCRENQIEFWNTETLHLETSARAPFSGAQSLAISGDGQLLAAGSSNGLVRVFNSTNQDLLKEFRTGTNSISELYFGPDGHTLATICHNIGLRILHLPDGAQIGSSERRACAAAFSPDGSTLALGTTWGEGTCLIDVRDSRPKVELNGHKADVVNLAFSPDGKRLATSSWDGTARLWDTTTGESLATFRSWFQGPGRLTFSPNGARLLVSSDRGIKMFAVDSKEELLTLADSRYPMPFFIDDDTILSLSDNEKLIQRRVPTLQQIDAASSAPISDR